MLRPIEEINELSRTVKPQYSAIHLNTRSLNEHFQQSCNLLDFILCKFDFIGCSETWFCLKLILTFSELTWFNATIA